MHDIRTDVQRSFHLALAMLAGIICPCSTSHKRQERDNFKSVKWNATQVDKAASLLADWTWLVLRGFLQ